MILPNNGLSGGETSASIGDGSGQETEDFWTTEHTNRTTRPSFSPITSRYESPPVSSGTFGCRDHNQLTPSTSTEGDAELALQLSRPNPIRRSTRLRDKVQTQDRPKPKVKPSRSIIESLSQAAPEAAPVIFSQAEPVPSHFEVAVASSTELPAIFSAQWQLMYPPGGSTHPCYPWPTADPRLLFQPHHVPLRNGLPDVSYAPVLTLPPNWRHVSWAGLHPIVFDPSQQGFKLTPVGPMPLTCEEIHQGGLQDYVPGGRLHPEFGMLPIMSSLSDGSDDEVYNFNGVDWKLSWAEIEGGFEVESTGTLSRLAADAKLSANSEASVIPSVEIQTYYIEERDCPDDVTDLEDAWRWLKEWDTNSPIPFTATPGKTWFRSGIPLTTRTMKQPIASLMALNMADKTPGVEHWLVKQVRREFCPLRSVATPPHVDITLLQDVEFTIVELLSFFPFHYQWRGAANRLVRCGMGASVFASLVNMVRRLPAGSLCNASTVYGYLRLDRDEDDNKARPEPSSNHTCYTAEHWSNVAWDRKMDYPLLGLIVGLRELPSGVDAGPLTTLIKWCRHNGRDEVMLSEVPNLLKEANIEALIDPGAGTDPDKEVPGRYADAIKNDRRRVTKEQQILKEQKEAEMEVEAPEGAREKRVKRGRLE
ncbi:hypothetical protein N0V86_006601 [Didymella sp. IMI 355093]|nr:hypothetical protein N0V86_006601 [Didymella sp. IMI 355093]